MPLIILWSNDKEKQIKKGPGCLLSSACLPYEQAKIVSHKNPDGKAEYLLPETAEGDLVLAMGDYARAALAHHKLIPKNLTIGKLRCAPIALPSGATCLLTYSAHMEEIDYSSYIDMLTDTRLLVRIARTGTIYPMLGTYRRVNNFNHAVKWLRQRHVVTGEPVPFSMDLETKGKDPYHPDAYIISVQVTYRPGESDVVYFNNREECLAAMQDQVFSSAMVFLMTAHKQVLLRGSGFKYDRGWLSKIWGLTECTTFKFDTLLVGSLLDENRSNSLKVHAKIYTDIGGYSDEFDKKYDKSRMDLVPMEEVLVYGGADSDAAYRVADEEKKEILQDELLTNFYVTLLHPAARSYEKVEQVGWVVDVPYYEHLKDELTVEVLSLEERAKEVLGGRLVAKHMENDGRLNLTKASLLSDFMFGPIGLNLKPKMRTEKTKKPSTAMQHIQMFKEHQDAKEFITILDEYSEASKALDTYVIGFMKHLRSDGRFHPNYFLFRGSDFSDSDDDSGGTNTGRLSVKEPAIQTIPKHLLKNRWAKKIRRAFCAPPGYLILSNDFSQGELKIAACLANEENMIAAYRAGIDLHAVTASALAGYSWDQFMALKKENPELFEEIRQLGKAGNFGLIYGMSAGGFVAYALVQYGVQLTAQEGEEKRDAFFRQYPSLSTWHTKYISFAEQRGFTRSPLGRIRHLPLIHSPISIVSSKERRRAVNSPVQSTLSDMSLWSTAEIDRYGYMEVAPVYGMIHDQLLSYVPEDNYQYYAERRVEIMENLPFHELGWEPQLSFSVDSQIGKNLAELKTLEVAR